MIKLRKENHVLIYGTYSLLDKDNPNIYAYTRTLGKQKVLVLLNFTAKISIVNTGIHFSNAVVLCSNYTEPGNGEELRPYEAVIYRIL